MKPEIVGYADKIKNVTEKDIDVLAYFMSIKYREFLIIKKDDGKTTFISDGFEYVFTFDDQKRVEGISVEFKYREMPYSINHMVPQRLVMAVEPYQREILDEIEGFVEKVKENY